ncbi:hypothetical protein L873DRAFT_1696063 [Choiromyces venosus 120613-1]|uniref:Uncharacterized protein n=1 Tax=Choiromyces venosus 120613-1 TaxID=1336337 RepID=A0A3N4JGY4_9PEZI|nr:hypothetical protein L873DRAFT_1696063 [Choiromyces venosus 120613-1]
MPPPLPQPPTLNSTVEITKYLRSRDLPLPNLLSFAEKVRQDNKVFFPRKEEWLLEWLVQRLGEKGDGSARARCNPAFWRMLLKLLHDSSQASIATILRKHSFLQVVGKTLSEAKALPVAVVGGALEGGEGVLDIDGGEMYHTPREEPISVDSSGTEEGFSVTYGNVEASVSQLLPGIYNVLSYLQEQAFDGVKKDNGVVAALRGTPEFGAQVLGSYFEACLVLIKAEKNVSEEWTRSVLNVWKSCIWGNPNSKKASFFLIFSTTCLMPVNNLLAFQPPQPTLQPYLEELLLEFIFTPEIIFPSTPGKPSKASSKELMALMEPLKSQTTGRVQLFRLAIGPQLRRSKPDIETVEALMQAVVPLSYAKTSPQIFTEVLELLVENNINLSSETLSLIVDETSGLASGRARDVKWRLIDLALKLDFDIFLGGSNQRRGDNLIHAIGHASVDDNNEQILKTLKVLIESYAKARNLAGFIELWAKELRSRAALWENDAVAKMVGDRLEKGLSSFQIEKVFKQACEAGSDLDWVLIDALLRGVRTEVTEAKIKRFLPNIVDAAEACKNGWRRWRVLLRVIQIDRAVVDQGFSQRVKPSAKKNVDPREILFFKEFQIALSGANTVSPVDDALGVPLPSDGVAHWTGSVKDINNQNLCLALNTGFANNWLESIEHIRSLPAKEKFIDHFLDMALHTKDDEKSLISAQGIWLNMLADGEFFELPTLKGGYLMHPNISFPCLTLIPLDI